MKRFFCLACLFVLASADPESLLMTESNNIVVRGTITETTADAFILDLLLKEPEFVYIASNGGSVSAGSRMVTQIQSRNLTCVAEKAYSMAFVLLQACTRRYVTSTATVMQHQMSLGLRGSLMNMNNYLDMVNHVEEHLNRMQADRIGLNLTEFERLVSTDWWMAGENIIENGVADEMVQVACAPELVKRNVTVTKQSFFGDDVVETYSACPLLIKPIHKEYKEGGGGFFFMDTNDQENEIYLITA